ncbi:MAG: peptidase C11 [Lachnospiraceae bacterium]|nr:peptidase C11 [Lachnospiraceae bacterium]
MDTNNRPHSREKTTSNQTANLNKGGTASSRPAGGGSRPSSNSRPSSGENRSSDKGVTRSGGSSKLLILIIAAVVLFGGGGGLSSLLGGGTSDSTNSGGGAGDLFSSLLGSGTTSSTTLTTGQAQSSTTTNTTSAKADMTVSSQARAKRVTPVGNGNDVVTIMVYMCGTDLESKYSMATKDLQEMIKATHSDQVNIIVETGGCKQWKNNVVSSSTNQIYQVVDDGLQLLQDNLGNKSMTDTDNLTSFIQYCNKNYPADRNILIFWDHGGGSITGYGYDEKHSSSGSMSLVGINTALKNAGCTFDWIGFDACLMATLETALVCDDYADYLIASEETEPGTGWYYTNWLTTLAKNPSTPTVTLATQLIDDFVSTSTASNSREQVSLSIVDLAELEGTVPEEFKNFSTSTATLLQSDNYTQVSNARAGARQFAQSSKINQIDLVDFANRVGTSEAKKLVTALKGAVKYNNTTISNAYGISIFFPYESLTSMNSALSTYDSLGIDSEYAKCIRSFASMEKAGQITASASTSGYGTGVDIGSLDLGSLLGGSDSPLTSLLGGMTSSSGSSSAGVGLDAGTVLQMLSAFSGRSIPTEYEWIDEDSFASAAEYVSENYINPEDITITWKDGNPYLALSDAQWNLMQTVELNVFVDDGEGYLDLGLDNTFEFEDNDLSLDYDRTWLTVNGQAVAYYLVSDTEEEDGSWTTIGRIPAILNDTQVNLEVLFDKDHPEGIITGATPVYDDDEDVDVLAKGSVEIVEGDEISFLCDYYDYDGDYTDSYYLGDTITVDADGLKLVNMNIGDFTCSVTYRLTDVYGNHYWTPAWISES